MPFTYSDDDLRTLTVFLSPERLAMYMKAVKYAVDITDRTRKALRRYEQNTALSEALYPVIQGFEVTLRKAVDNRVAADLGADWLDTFHLRDTEKEAIAEAKRKIVDKHSP